MTTTKARKGTLKIETPNTLVPEWIKLKRSAAAYRANLTRKGIVGSEAKHLVEEYLQRHSVRP
jgi:hypothetical protein